MEMSSTKAMTPPCRPPRGLDMKSFTSNEIRHASSRYSNSMPKSRARKNFPKSWS